MKHFYFDIETVPSQLDGVREQIAAEITPPGNISKAETIVAWEAEKKPALVEAEYLKTSFDGGLGQICVIGFALNEGEPVAYAVEDLSRDAERKVLQDFFCAVTDAGSHTCFIGHNVIGFDIRFVWQRAMVLGVKPPFIFPRDPKPWGETTFDTMTAWSGIKDRVSMNKLCRVFGLPDKGDIDGSKVWPMVQAGQIKEVADYCKGDVIRTRLLHKRMTFAA